MLIFWNLPIRTDGRYLANGVGNRESNYSYLRSATEATDNVDCANASPPTDTLPQRSLIAERKP
jgi:hypothetical protein